MNPAPMHICFCIPAITGGGAERTVANLLTLFHKMGTRLTLLTYEAPAAVPAYPLPDIPVLRLDLLGGSGFERIWKIFTRRRRIRDEIARIDADVVVSFMDTMNVAVTVALRGSAKPVVISERVDPAHHPLPAWKQVMRRIVYPMSQMLIVQTGRVARYFTWIDDDRITVIPNPVHPQENLASPDRPGKDGRFSIVAVGRLARQKGFDDLIRAFADLRDDFPDWDLSIFGEGPDRNALAELIRSFDAGDRIALPGWRSDIETAFASAHIMAFPSHYEGFPNALCEAAAAGLPLIGFAGVSGVEDIIVDGDNGILIGSGDRTDGLCAALSTLMADAPLRCDMGRRAKSRMDDCRPERIAAMWQSVFALVMEEHRK